MSDEEKSQIPEAGVERHYYSQRPSLKFRLNGVRETFRNGIFIARGQDQINAMEKALADMTPSARSEIKTISADRAVQIARQHKNALGQAAFQGGMTTAARAKEIDRVRDLINQNELRDQNLQSAAGNATVEGGTIANIGGVQTENVNTGGVRINIPGVKK